MKVRRAVAASAVAVVLLVGTTSVVTAHECYIANRSAQGDAGALHSGVWARITLADVFGFINQFVGGDALTPSQIEWAVGAAVGEGLPANGWVVRSDKIIGEDSHDPNLANGKGLDHLADVYGDQLIGIYFAALGQ